jgi:hypothetical protein
MVLLQCFWNGSTAVYKFRRFLEWFYYNVVFVFSECLGLLLGPGPNNEVILICFDLFDIFVCKCVPL